MQYKKTIPASSHDTDVIINVSDPVVDIQVVDIEPNKPPTITDGSPVSITLPINEAILSAAANDPDGTIALVKWEQVSGNPATIADSTLLTTKATFTKEGDYQFKVTVADNDGATASSLRTITVKPAPVVTSKIFPITSAPVLGEYSRPFAGPYEWNGVSWDGSQALKLTPSQDTYQRMNWFDFEYSTEGKIDFTKFDGYVNAAIKKGQKFYWGGIMPICQGCSGGNVVDGAQLGYPLWLHKKMMADSNSVNRPWIATDANCWVPNWNSPLYLSACENVLLKIAQHINTNGWDKYISCIDIRLYGNWGEWHVYPWYWHQPKGTTATVATLKRIVDAHINAFPDIPLVIISAAYDPGNASLMPPEFSYYVLNAKNNWGPVGWRRDNWGAKGSDNHLINNPASWNGVKLSSIIIDKWKTSIVTGEPTADYSETGDYGDLLREINLYHPSNIGNGNYSKVPPPDTMKSNLTIGYNAIGYRIGITKGNVTWGPDKLNIQIDWTNTGVAPVIEKYETWFEIGSWKGKGSFDPKFFLPGTKTTSDDFPIPNLPAGSYDLKISLIDPTGVRRNNLPLSTVINCNISI